MALRKDADTLPSIPDAYAGAQVFHMDPGNQPRLEATLCLKLQTRAAIYRAGNPFSPQVPSWAGE